MSIAIDSEARIRPARAGSGRSGGPVVVGRSRQIDAVIWGRSCSEPAVCSGSAVCTLPVVDRAVPAVRSFVCDVATAWRVSEEVGYALRVIATELVTNVLQHSGSPDVSLLLAVHGSVVTIHVSDTGKWRERRGESGERPVPDEEAESGRGLLLVRAYATRFAVDRTMRGSTVSAEIEMARTRGT